MRCEVWLFKIAIIFLDARPVDNSGLVMQTFPLWICHEFLER